MYGAMIITATTDALINERLTETLKALDHQERYAVSFQHQVLDYGGQGFLFSVCITYKIPENRDRDSHSRAVL